jgi:Tfp pilus assembly protein PilF
MMKNSEATPLSTSAGAFLLLSALCLLVYGNSFDASWHLDDYSNITQNPSVHITEWGWESLLKPIQAGLKDGRLDRPVASLTFALNWLFGQDSPAGYHLVNLALHILTGWLLFLTVCALYRTPRMRGASASDIPFICLLGTVFWAVNPVQTQAVTYIVQRMALLAAVFSILGLLAYVRCRLAAASGERMAWALVCAASFFLGIGSKENAIVQPLVLVMAEIAFFQDLSKAETRRRLAIFGISGCLAVFGLGVLIFLKGDPAAVLSYSNRYFTPWERLLTQARVLLFYVSLLFYPAPTRLSIEHDVILSTSLVSPWTTLPCLAIILALIGLSVFQLKKRPLVAFATLFFFIHHLVESTVIGLELIFEHRNYLPSMFIFFPIAGGLKRLLNHYHPRSGTMVWALRAFIVLLVVGLGSGTYVRNQTWFSEQSLWEDAAGKAPTASRPLHNLAWGHYERMGDYATALRLYEAAMKGTKTNIHQESIILNNMASIYYTVRDYRKAEDFWRQSIDSHPDYPETYYRLALALTRQDKLDEAGRRLDQLLAKHPAHAFGTNLKGIVLFRQGNYAESLSFFKQALKAKPTQLAATINLGSVYLQIGEPSKAMWFFKRADARNPGQKLSLLWMAFQESASGNPDQAGRCLDRLLDVVKLPEVLTWMGTSAAGEIYRDSILLPRRTPEIMAVLETCLARRLGFEAEGPSAVVARLP